MARYIDAYAFLENLKKQYGEDLGWQYTVNMSDIGKMIDDTPTADVAEVVYCEKCIHYEPHGNGKVGVCKHPKCKGLRYEGEFCSYGE